jgi:hypothetical protein
MCFLHAIRGLRQSGTDRSLSVVRLSVTLGSGQPDNGQEFQGSRSLTIPEQNRI